MMQLIDSLSDMDISEIVVLFFGLIFTVAFLIAWYCRIFVSASLPSGKTRLERYTLSALPLAAFAVIFYILRFHASSDVVDSPLYISFYVLIGFAWLYICVGAMFLFFDLSWKDDVLGL
jgi:hypothetical protein